MSDQVNAKQIAGKNLYRGLAIGLGVGIFLGHFVDANPATEFLAMMAILALFGASERYDFLQKPSKPD